jgi:hypothetical protein
MKTLQEAEYLAQAIRERFDGQIDVQASSIEPTTDYEGSSWVGFFHDGGCVGVVRSMKEVERLLDFARVLITEDLRDA